MASSQLRRLCRLWWTETAEHRRETQGLELVALAALRLEHPRNPKQGFQYDGKTDIKSTVGGWLCGLGCHCHPFTRLLIVP